MFLGIPFDNKATDGYNIWNALNKKEEFKRQQIVYNLDIDDQSPNFHFAIRLGDWKLFWGQPGKFQVNIRQKHVLELYNLREDPYEEVNLLHNKLRGSKYFSKVEELQSVIYELLKEMKAAYQPNRYSLAFPAYNDGIISPGWCSSGWNKILWKQETHWEQVLAQLISYPDEDENIYDQ